MLGQRTRSHGRHFDLYRHRQITMKLQDNLCEFDDGFTLEDAYGLANSFELEGPTLPVTYTPMDQLHKDAIAFVGQVALSLDWEETPPVVLGKHGHNTTVFEMLQALKQWWQQYEETHDTRSVEMLQMSLDECDGWEEKDSNLYKLYVPKGNWE